MSELEERKPTVKAHVQAGVCRFTCDILAYNVDDGIRCDLVSECSSVRKFGEALGTMDPFCALKMPFCENEIYGLAGEFLSHASCPIPMAVIKCVEIASGLALARDVIVRFEV